MSPRNSVLVALASVALSPTTVAQVAPGGAGALPGTGLQWVLGFAAEVDDDSNDSLLTTFNVGLAEDTWFSLTAGRSRSPQNAAELDADTLGLGFDHSFGLVGIGLFAEQWGDAGNLESDDRRGVLSFQRERFRLAFERERRDVDLYFRTTDLLGRIDLRSTGITARGTGVTYRVRVAERWQLYGTARWFRYSRNLAALPRIASLNLLSASTLTLANSFVDRQTSVGFEWTFRDRLLNVGIGGDRSAIDGSRLRTVDAAVLFPVGRRMDLELNVGYSSSDLIRPSVHAGVLILVYGGR